MSQQIISSRKNHIADFQGILLIKANHLLKPTFFLLLPWFRDLSSSFHPSIYGPSILEQTEVGIYKRKQEGKKTRKQEFDQESDQENKKKRKKTRSRPKSDQEKRKNFLFFLITFLFSCFLTFLLSCFTL